jgi:hypothetical protein
MATVGQALTTPEATWRRYDDTDSRIKYAGNWIKYTDSARYNGGDAYTTSLNDSVTFKFYGTKLRIISLMNVDNSNSISITIDGSTEYYSQINASLLKQALVYEKTGLTLGKHTVIITNNVGSKYCNIDAIDMDDTGYLVHPTLNQISDINTMQVGDCIPYRYTAPTSGQAGTFSELGTCIANEIPITGTATPDGLFYLIKTDKGTLIADRVIQTSISWDVLNTAKYIEGYPFNVYLNESKINQVSTTNLVNSSHSINSIIDNDITTYAQFDNILINNYVSVNVTLSSPLSELKALSYCPPLQSYSTQPSHIQLCLIDGTVLATYNNASANLPKNIYSYFTIPSNNYNVTEIILKFQCYSSSYPVIIGEIKFFKTIYTYSFRSLSGGVAYIDANGNSSTTDKSLGAWPPNNEWDKYIVNSDLKGKITKGDDNIWHWNNNKASWTKDTPINGMNRGDGWLGQNDRRIHNKLTTTGEIKGRSYSTSSYVGVEIGFRPVLNYVESDIASGVIY